MPTAKNAELQYESSATPTAFTTLTDSGDQTTFTSSATYWSKKTGFGYTVRPDGVATGMAVTPGSANDTVDIAAGTYYVAGALTNISASSGFSITRSATDPYKIISIVITGGSFAEVEGTVHASAFNEVRGTAGGPPFIPVGSIEVAQVRLTSVTAGLVTTSEIKQQIGTHQERWDFPGWTADLGNAQIVMDTALPQSHTGSVPKRVYAEFSDPSFTTIQLASDFVPPTNSVSVSSTEIYRNRTLGATSTTLNSGSFTFYPENGVTDSLLGADGDTLWFKFFPDRTKTAFWLAQGTVSIVPSFPAGDNMSVAVTIASEEAATRHAS